MVTAAILTDPASGAFVSSPFGSYITLPNLTMPLPIAEGESLAEGRCTTYRIMNDKDMRCDRSVPYVNQIHSLASFFITSLCHVILAGNCTYDTASLPYACMAKQTSPLIEYIPIPADFWMEAGSSS